MKQTSLEAYAKLDRSARRRSVFEVIRRRPERGWTRQEVADELGWSINRVTGRVRELLDAELIYEDGTRFAPEYRRNHGVVKVVREARK